MAFLLDKGIAAESEEEFDAETDRYEELKNKLLGGQTMKYEEMEELLAAAKARNDQRVIDALRNVVDDPPADAVTESEKEPTKSELLDKLIKMCKPGSGVRIALEEIKDKFALDESEEDEDWKADPEFNPDDWKADDQFVKGDEYDEMVDIALADRSSPADLKETADDPTGAPLDLLSLTLDRLQKAGDLNADRSWIEDSDKLVLTYEDVGWYENLESWAEDPQDDIESDLTKIYDALEGRDVGTLFLAR